VIGENLVPIMAALMACRDRVPMPESLGSGGFDRGS
jgi:hypothetical protein